MLKKGCILLVLVLCSVFVLGQKLDALDNKILEIYRDGPYLTFAEHFALRSFYKNPTINSFKSIRPRLRKTVVFLEIGFENIDFERDKELLPETEQALLKIKLWNLFIAKPLSERTRNDLARIGITKIEPEHMKYLPKIEQLSLLLLTDRKIVETSYEINLPDKKLIEPRFGSHFRWRQFVETFLKQLNEQEREQVVLFSPDLVIDWHNPELVRVKDLQTLANAKPKRFKKQITRITMYHAGVTDHPNWLTRVFRKTADYFDDEGTEPSHAVELLNMMGPESASFLVFDLLGNPPEILGNLLEIGMEGYIPLKPRDVSDKYRFAKTLSKLDLYFSGRDDLKELKPEFGLFLEKYIENTYDTKIKVTLEGDIASYDIKNHKFVTAGKQSKTFTFDDIKKLKDMGITELKVKEDGSLSYVFKNKGITIRDTVPNLKTGELILGKGQSTVLKFADQTFSVGEGKIHIAKGGKLVIQSKSVKGKGSNNKPAFTLERGIMEVTPEGQVVVREGKLSTRSVPKGITLPKGCRVCKAHVDPSGEIIITQGMEIKFNTRDGLELSWAGGPVRVVSNDKIIFNVAGTTVLKNKHGVTFSITGKTTYYSDEADHSKEKESFIQTVFVDRKGRKIHYLNLGAKDSNMIGVSFNDGHPYEQVRVYNDGGGVKIFDWKKDVSGSVLGSVLYINSEGKLFSKKFELSRSYSLFSNGKEGRYVLGPNGEVGKETTTIPKEPKKESTKQKIAKIEREIPMKKSSAKPTSRIKMLGIQKNQEKFRKKEERYRIDARIKSLVSDLPSDRGVIDQLADIGKPAIPYLLKVIKRASDTDVRLRAGRALGGMGKEAVQPLIDLMTSEEESDLTRSFAAAALGKTMEREAVGPLLATLAHDKSSYVRFQSAAALGDIGTGDKIDEALKYRIRAALEKAQEDSDGHVRYMAERSLGRIIHQR